MKKIIVLFLVLVASFSFIDQVKAIPHSGGAGSSGRSVPIPAPPPPVQYTPVKSDVNLLTDFIEASGATLLREKKNNYKFLLNGYIGTIEIFKPSLLRRRFKTKKKEHTQSFEYILSHTKILVILPIDLDYNTQVFIEDVLGKLHD